MECPSTLSNRHKPSQAAPCDLAELYAATPHPHSSLQKREHLCRQKLIEHLFSKDRNGRITTTCFPLRAVCRPVPEALQEPGETCVSVLFSVSKRCFKRAVRRNRAKRQMREAYRLLRHDFMQTAAQSGQHFCLAFIWMSHTPQPSPAVASAMHETLHTLTTRLQEQTATDEALAPQTSLPDGETPCQP